jgi:hypothetical protein
VTAGRAAPMAGSRQPGPPRADAGLAARHDGAGAAPVATFRPGQRPLDAAAWYCSTTLAGMRPRSLTARPWSRAQALMSPER